MEEEQESAKWEIRCLLGQKNQSTQTRNALLAIIPFDVSGPRSSCVESSQHHADKTAKLILIAAPVS